MTEPESPGPQRLRLLAGYLAGRAVDVAEAPAGQPAHTDGQVVFVSPGASAERQRREVLVQAGLLGAGSLD
ncbi:VWA domain-containing protein, partial [Mycolicibacterium chitae]|nr:VWA domain-containing protein [Mycolicibacterium chitae]